MDYDQQMAAAPRRQDEMLAAFGFDSQPQQRKPFAFADGMAFIPVHGVLLNRFAYSLGFVTGYDFIRAQMRAAEADPDVKSIVFDVNSPGGMVAGCQELSADIAKAGKPTLAVVDANSLSAAYWLTSAADKIALTPSGQVGSIGAVVMHASFAKALEADGVEITFIYAGQHKVDGNPYEVLPDSVKAEIQSVVDAAYDQFCAGVAANRDLPAQAIRDTEARVYSAEAALEMKLVDAVQPAGEAVMAWTNELSGSGSNTESDIMADANNQPNEAVTTERQRIQGILGHAEAVGREALAQTLALTTDLSVDAAAAILATAEKKAAAPVQAPAPAPNAFRQAMDGSEHPNVGDGGAGGAGAQQPANRLLASLDDIGFKRENETTH
jgi:capsid assembly protease